MKKFKEVTTAHDLSIIETESLEQVIVTAAQMRQIEERIFAARMPVSALMEKAALLTAMRIQELYPVSQFEKVGVLVGPGHNGGDALVIARELYLKGYQVIVYRPISRLKELTSEHAHYAASLGINFYAQIETLQTCQLIIDGLFGFGLSKEISGKVAEAIKHINQWQKPVVSIDIPSGLHTDTGEVLGIAIKATYSLCLGLWKLAFFQDIALEYIGKAERIDFGIPAADVWAILGNPAPIKQITKAIAVANLPLNRSLTTHKYQQGHLLLICGSRRYAGAAILAGLGARVTGVGMLSIAVPTSLKPILLNYLPEALIIECPETESGAIAELPLLLSDLSKYSVIACGSGLTLEAKLVLKTVLNSKCPLVLDADGLNILAELGAIDYLSKRKFTTVITPHLGEFKRLFSELLESNLDRISLAKTAAEKSQAIVLLKGARTVISDPQYTWLIPESTPALARGGSGDILTGLIGGLMAQKPTSENQFTAIVATAAWWHAQAGIFAAKERTELGVDPYILCQYLIRVLDF